MPTEIPRDWIVVEGNSILYRGDSRVDADEWADANRGEVIAVPERGTAWI